MIPTTTGAARVVTKVLPELKGRLDGTSVRVPTWDGSLYRPDLRDREAGEHREDQRRDEAAAAGSMKNIIEYTEDPIVSIDVIGNPHSAVFDAKSTMALEDVSLK
jgi:glyceraldehyde 3-phosphate dehydrogenase